MRLNKGLIFLLVFACGVEVFSQSVSTPYSNYGLGEIADFSLPHHEAMAGLGVGSPGSYNINSQNPAWLVYNFLTTFQTGLKGETRNYSGGEGNKTDRSGSLRYLAVSFPFIPSKWSSSVTLLPYSSCLLYTSPSPRDRQKSRMPSSA